MTCGTIAIAVNTSSTPAVTGDAEFCLTRQIYDLADISVFLDDQGKFSLATQFNCC